MSKRCDFVSRTASILTVAVVLLVCVATASAQSPAAVFRIDTSLNYPLGPTVGIPVILEYLEPGREINSLELTIGIGSQDQMQNYAGSTFRDLAMACNWGYLEWSETVHDCEGDHCPDWLLHLKLWDIPGESTCPIDAPLELGTMLFRTNGELDTFYPIRFFWSDCDENVVSFIGGEDTMLVSQNIFQYDGTDITADLPFLNYTGAPDSCLDPALDDTVRVRAIDFYHGGLKMTVVDTPFVARSAVKIEKTHGTDPGEVVDISITLETLSPGTEYLTISNFDFLIQWNPTAATFQSAQPGQLLVDCEWEYFTYRYSANASCGEGYCPSGVVRMVGLADTENGSHVPLCLADSVGELAVVTFLATTDPAWECIYSPIRWLWYDCGDNVVAVEPTGENLFVSNRIYDFDGSWWINQEREFPTTYGAPYECTGEIAPGKYSTRAIDYYHGGFDFTCADSIDNRGDINLNGIANEIADYVLFMNYFIYGLGVFINVEAQTAASDVNADGVPLTLDDMIYMYRIIIGDALPYPAPPSPPSPTVDTCVIVQDIDAQTVSIEYADSLAAVYMTFGDSILPVFDLPNHDAGGEYVAPHTKVLVVPQLSSTVPHFGAGELFTYTGTGHLLSAEVSYDGLMSIPVVIRVEGASGCCLNRGNVDGVGGSSQPVDVADLTYLVRYLFTGGSLPPCIEEGNVDGTTGSGGLINIADVTYLVAFMFVGGPPPPPCP
ncbi:MAG: dockerin type I repeat-containing protein [candidate division Zixibacteria bacterium]|nr:dockerin type I repeat-containing protein [candidate division Zixibacteria bacterium]